MDPGKRRSNVNQHGDISSRTNTVENLQGIELQKRQDEKLAAIGNLASGIAHEINTPVQYITDNVKFLDETVTEFIKALKIYQQIISGLDSDVQSAATDALTKHTAGEGELAFLVEEAPDAAKHAASGLKQVAKIVGSIKAFAHPGEDEKAFADVNEIVETVTMISKSEWKYVAMLETDLDPNLPPVLCFAGELHQVFLNMLMNAVHAIQDSAQSSLGVIRIETKKSDGYANIMITDDGCGICAVNSPKIMDPFFTTKVCGRGTGQGLSLCRSIIEDKHGGKISFDSEVGVGTTFHIQIPVRENKFEKEVQS